MSFYQNQFPTSESFAGESLTLDSILDELKSTLEEKISLLLSECEAKLIQNSFLHTQTHTSPSLMEITPDNSKALYYASKPQSLLSHTISRHLHIPSLLSSLSTKLHTLIHTIRTSSPPSEPLSHAQSFHPSPKKNKNIHLQLSNANLLHQLNRKVTNNMSMPHNVANFVSESKFSHFYGRNKSFKSIALNDMSISESNFYAKNEGIKERNKEGNIRIQEIGEENTNLKEKLDEKSAFQNKNEGFYKIGNAKVSNWLKNEENGDLSVKLKEEREVSKGLRNDLAKCKEKTTKLTMEYYKELAQLREMVYRKSNIGEKYEFSEVRFFSPNEGLDPEISDLLNTRIREMKQVFQIILSQLNESISKSNKKINLYKKLSPKDYPLVEMPIIDIFQKVYILEDDPFIIWGGLKEAFGHEFLLEPIENEYGGEISKFSKQLMEEFDKIKKEALSTVDDIIKNNNIEIQYLKKSLKESRKEVASIRDKHLADIDSYRKAADKMAEDKYKQIEDDLRLSYEEERDELVKEMKYMAELSAQSDKTLMRHMLSTMLLKWRLMATIKKLKKEKDGNVPQTQITLAERKLGNLVTSSSHLDLNELNKLKKDNYQLKKKNAHLHYSIQDLEDNTKNLENLLEDYKQDILFNIETKEASEQSNRKYLAQIDDLKKQAEYLQTVIEEIDNVEPSSPSPFGNDDKPLNSSRKKSVETPSSPKSPGLRKPRGKSTFKAGLTFVLRHQSIQEVKEKRLNALREVYRQDRNEQGVMTNMKNLTNEIGFVCEIEKKYLRPKLDAEIQTDLFKFSERAYQRKQSILHLPSKPNPRNKSIGGSSKNATSGSEIQKKPRSTTVCGRVPSNAQMLRPKVKPVEEKLCAKQLSSIDEKNIQNSHRMSIKRGKSNDSPTSVNQNLNFGGGTGSGKKSAERSNSSFSPNNKKKKKLSSEKETVRISEISTKKEKIKDLPEESDSESEDSLDQFFTKPEESMEEKSLGGKKVSEEDESGKMNDSGQQYTIIIKNKSEGKNCKDEGTKIEKNKLHRSVGGGSSFSRNHKVRNIHSQSGNSHKGRKIKMDEDKYKNAISYLYDENKKTKPQKHKLDSFKKDTPAVYKRLYGEAQCQKERLKEIREFFQEQREARMDAVLESANLLYHPEKDENLKHLKLKDGLVKNRSSTTGLKNTDNSPSRRMSTLPTKTPDVPIFSYSSEKKSNFSRNDNFTAFPIHSKKSQFQTNKDDTLTDNIQTLSLQNNQKKQSTKYGMYISEELSHKGESYRYTDDSKDLSQLLDYSLGKKDVYNTGMNLHQQYQQYQQHQQHKQYESSFQDYHHTQYSYEAKSKMSSSSNTRNLNPQPNPITRTPLMSKYHTTPDSESLTHNPITTTTALNTATNTATVNTGVASTQIASHPQNTQKTLIYSNYSHNPRSQYRHVTPPHPFAYGKYVSSSFSNPFSYRDNGKPDISNPLNNNQVLSSAKSSAANQQKDPVAVKPRIPVLDETLSPLSEILCEKSAVDSSSSANAKQNRNGGASVPEVKPTVFDIHKMSNLNKPKKMPRSSKFEVFSQEEIAQKKFGKQEESKFFESRKSTKAKIISDNLHGRKSHNFKNLKSLDSSIIKNKQRKKGIYEHKIRKLSVLEREDHLNKSEILKTYSSRNELISREKDNKTVDNS